MYGRSLTLNWVSTVCTVWVFVFSFFSLFSCIFFWFFSEGRDKRKKQNIPEGQTDVKRAPSMIIFICFSFFCFLDISWQILEIIVIILIIGLGMNACISNINYAIDRRYLRIRIWVFTFRKFPISDFKDIEIGVTVDGENWTNTIDRKKIKKSGVTLYKNQEFFSGSILLPMSLRNL